MLGTLMRLQKMQDFDHISTITILIFFTLFLDASVCKEVRKSCISEWEGKGKGRPAELFLSVIPPFKIVLTQFSQSW